MLRQGRVEGLTLPTGVYQLIFSVDVLHHLRHRIDTLRQALEQAGFTGVREELVEERYTLTSATSFQDKAYSCLRPIPEQAFQAGLEHLRRDLAGGPVIGTWRSFLLSAQRPCPT